MIIISSTKQGLASFRGMVAPARMLLMPRHDRSESRLRRQAASHAAVGCSRTTAVSSEAHVARVAAVGAVLGPAANANIQPRWLGRVARQKVLIVQE
jgi:hypothetical protein